MAYFAWVGQEQTLSPVALTIRAQTLSPTDRGNLVWDIFFPRNDVNSVKLRTIMTADFRPVSDRREWNARGRLIPLRSPKIDELEMVPIEAYFNMGEREIQELEEATLGNQTIFRQMVGADIPKRVDGLAMANYRRIEMDGLRAWANGTLIARNPQTNTTQTFTYGFDAGRYQTAGTAWNAVANAYQEFITFVLAGITAGVNAVGAYMRQATLTEIQNDAPTGLNGGIRLTRAQLLQRVQDDLGRSFNIVTDDRTAQPFVDAGIDVVTEKYWPIGKVALIPAGNRIGSTAFAPVTRAMEVARNAPSAGIDIRGQVVYHEVSGNGRFMQTEVQVNAAPVPDENNLWVIDAGV